MDPVALRHALSPSAWMSSVESGKYHSSMLSHMESIGSAHLNDILKLSANRCWPKNSENSRQMESYRERYFLRFLHVLNILSQLYERHSSLSSKQWASGEKRQDKKSLSNSGIFLIEFYNFCHAEARSICWKNRADSSLYQNERGFYFSIWTVSVIPSSISISFCTSGLTMSGARAERVSDCIISAYPASISVCIWP